MGQNKRRSARPINKRARKTAIIRRPGDPKAGKGGIVPPEEHRFQAGNQAAVGHGRPRNLGQLRELIQALGNESLTKDGLTRLQAMLRGMYASKNSSDKNTLLEYGFGKVAQPLEWRDALAQEGLDPADVFERMVAAAASALERDADGTDGSRGPNGSAPPAGPGTA